MATKKRGTGKRELIAPNGDKRYTRRTGTGAFAKNQDDVGRSLSQDIRKKAKTRVKSGSGDKGDESKRGAGKKSGTKRSATKRASTKRASTKRTATKKSATKRSATKRSAGRKSA